MRKRLLTGALALVVAGGAVGTAPGRADAIAGTPREYEANHTVSITIGDAARGQAIWACSGAQVGRGWVLTTATCLRESGAAPATNGAAPLKPVTVGAEVLSVAIHPTADVALLRVSGPSSDLYPERLLPLADAAPAVGDSVEVGGYGRTSDEWVPSYRHDAVFQVQSTTATTFDVTPTGAGVVCKGDAGGPAVRNDGGRIKLFGLLSASSQGGCLGAAATTDHNATVVRVDGLGPWVNSWTLNTGFESTDPIPFTNTGAYGSASVAGVSGVCCSLTGPELTPRAEQPHTGTNVMMYSGRDTSDSRSFAYMKAYAAAGLPVTSTTLLRYWIWPQNTSPATGSNSSCVAVDLDFSDGKHLRDLKAYADNGATDSHPARQCGHLAMNRWNQVTVDVGAVAAGKKITQVNIAYDQPANTGGYRGLVDDIEIYDGCLAHGGKVCAHSAGARAAKATATTAEVNFDAPAETTRTSAVENYAYPNAADILENQKFKVISGNGALMLADCATPPTGGYGYIRVRSTNPEVGAGGQICLKASSGVGLINLEVPDVFSIRSDGQAPGEGHPTKATWRAGQGQPQSDSVPAGGILPIGVGTGDENPPATLLQILVNGA